MLGDFPCLLQAGVKYENGDNHVETGGGIQFQYHRLDPDGGQVTDELFYVSSRCILLVVCISTGKENCNGICQKH